MYIAGRRLRRFFKLSCNLFVTIPVVGSANGIIQGSATGIIQGSASGIIQGNATGIIRASVSGIIHPPQLVPWLKKKSTSTPPQGLPVLFWGERSPFFYLF
jgi:hypothetical protein